MNWEPLIDLLACLPCVIVSVWLTNRSGGTFHFGTTPWCFLLNLAELYGWQPAGTESPRDWDENEDGEWQGDYDTNDGQTVTPADARSLADAVAAALADPKLEDKAAELEAQFRQGVEARCGPELASVYQVGLGDEEAYRPHLEDFIRFCRQGAFEIE